MLTKCYLLSVDLNSRSVWVRIRVKVFNATFNNISVISWWSVLLVEETRLPGENHRPATSHWQTLSHNVVSSTPVWLWFKITTLVVIGTDCIGSCKYHTIMIMTMTAPQIGLRNNNYLNDCSYLLEKATMGRQLMLVIYK